FGQRLSETAATHTPALDGEAGEAPAPRRPNSVAASPRSTLRRRPRTDRRRLHRRLARLHPSGDPPRAHLPSTGLMADSAMSLRPVRSTFPVAVTGISSSTTISSGAL